MGTRRFLTEAEVAENIRQFLYDDSDNERDEGDDLDSLYGDEAIPSNGDHDESSDHQIDGNDHKEEEIVPPVRQ